MEDLELIPDDPQVPQNKKPLFSTNKRAFVDSVLNANKHLDWVQRLRDPNSPSIQLPNESAPPTHLMSDDGKGYVFPSVVRIGGKLKYIGDKAEDYARATNTGIQLPQTEGSWFAANGYKTGTNVLNNIGNNGRPYNDPKFKIKK